MKMLEINGTVKIVNLPIFIKNKELRNEKQGFLGASAVHEEKDQLYICIFLIINHSTTVCLSSYFWFLFFFLSAADRFHQGV